MQKYARCNLDNFKSKNVRFLPISPIHEFFTDFLVLKGFGDLPNVI